ncbi:MAG: head maturation protease, ClpP-related [Rhodococcus sp. (in: high G+C Gram-positive bacteria)]
MPDRRSFPGLFRPAASSKARDWYQIRNAAGDGSAEILIYDEIGDSWWGGVSAKDFVRDIIAIDADTITIRINSPGGDVFDGIAIMNAIKAHPATVTVYVDGLAASAASFIAMAGNDIIIRRNAEMMIHDPSGFCYGNAADMTDLAAQLDRIGTNIATMYADRAGGTVESWRDLMLAETWYSAEEAVTAGLADRVETGDNAEKKTKNSFDLSVFAYAGRKAAPTPPRIAVSTNTSAERAGANKKKESTVAFSEELAKRLGVDPEASEEELIAALDAQSGTTTETTTTETTPVETTPVETTQTETAPAGDPVESTQEPGQAANKAPATVVLDKGAYEQYLANQAQLQTFLDKQASDRRESVVTNALKSGKIVASTAQQWRDALKENPGIEKILDSMPAGGAAPVGEIGHGQDGLDGAENLSGDAQVADIRKSDAYTNWKF